MMDTWKAVFPDHSLPALSSKKRVLSGFALGVVGSLLGFSLLASLNAPSSSFYSSPIFSWFFSAPSSSSPLSASQNSVIIGAITHDGSGSPPAGQPDAHAKTLPGDARNSSDQGSAPGSSEQTHIVQSTANHGDGNLSQGAAITAETAHQVNASGNDPGVLNQEAKNAGAAADEGKAAGIVASQEESRPSSVQVEARKELSNKCDIFDGSWVRDESMPYYPAGSCPYLDDCFNCHKNGRPDEDFLKWRWQPHGCNIPRLNATDFLKRLRGKRLVFVGDSLNRNMWESLVCILRHSLKNKNKVYEVSGRQDFKTRGYYAFRFEDYECSVDFVRSPFLVRELYFRNANGSYDEKLRLDVLDETTSAYRKADIVVFNTGHWWSHEKSSRGIDYYQERNYVYPLLNVMEAYKKALTTWARWVDKNINSKRTQIFFRGYSLTHFRGGQWNSGGQCYRQSGPIFNETYLSKYPSKMRTLEDVLQQMKTPVIYLNISRLTDYRKDGHPSIYAKKYASIEEQIAAEKRQDCSHWCLPGVPDAWNELLYASLLMAGKGSWKR